MFVFSDTVLLKINKKAFKEKKRDFLLSLVKEAVNN